jgi:2-aminoethylphosphonate-pyruvate transaminase
MTRFNGPEEQEDMPYLLTPGPVTTSRDVKFAMLADWSPQDSEFASLVQRNMNTLKTLAGCNADYECILMEGSSSGGIEAALGSFTPAKRKKTLIVANGAQAQHPLQIMQRLGRHHILLDRPVLEPLYPDDIGKALDADRNISHVWVVHCETATGLLNPLADIAAVVKARGRVLMVDAIASFAGAPIDMSQLDIDVMITSPEHCLEAVPGFSIILVKRDVLLAAKGECHSMVLDVFEQWQHYQSTKQFRFTPPTHAIVALTQALRELENEGGVEGRAKRYNGIADGLHTRLKALGFSMVLPPALFSPLVQTVLSPGDNKFNFKTFQDKLRAKGFKISAGALAGIESFRVATQGQINEKLIMQLIDAIEIVMTEMDVRNFAPAKDT